MVASHSMSDNPLPWHVLFGMLLGLCLSVAMVFAAQLNLKLAAVVALCLPGAYVLGKRPAWVLALFLFCLLVFEEFPSGQGETLERSQRTTFYSLSLGIPGFYSTDLFLLVILSLYLIGTIIRREAFPVRVDTVLVCLSIIALVVAISSFNSILLRNAVNFDVHYEVELSGLGDFDQRAAALIGFFQIKIFAYLFMSYVAGLYFFTGQDRVRRFTQIFMVAAIFNVFVGVARLAADPSIITENKPLFYHSPSTWIFAMTIFYLLGLWMSDTLKGMGTYLAWALIGILAIYILVSFRRTMWGAIAICIIPYLMMATSTERRRIYPILAVGVAGLLGVLVFTPIGEAILYRLSETNTSHASSFYRLALFVYFFQNLFDLPVWGYGVEPLWNHQDASMGFFQFSLENIHSIYFWFLLRFGLLGFLVITTCLMVVFLKLIKIKRNPRFRAHRWLTTTMVLGFIMFMFSGIFNPVYGEARYMILLGLGLSLVTRLPMICPPVRPSLEQMQRRALV